MPRWRYALTATVAIVTATASAARAQGPDTLIFGATHETDSIIYRYAEDYLRQLCAEVRQRCQLQSLPGRRGTAMMAAGSLAGEVGRVHAYNTQHPEYRRVEEPFVTSRTYVFTRPDRPPVNSWQELGRVRSISYRRGIYTYQTRLDALRPAVQPHDVQTVPACLQMVLTRRDEACVFDDGSVTPEARSLLARGRIGKPLDELPLYIYLGRDHAVLADDFTAAARHLHARGVKAQLRRKYFASR